MAYPHPETTGDKVMNRSPADRQRRRDLYDASSGLWAERAPRSITPEGDESKQRPAQDTGVLE